MSSEHADADDKLEKIDVRGAMLDANSGLKKDQLDYAERRLTYALGQLRKYKAQEAGQ